MKNIIRLLFVVSISIFQSCTIPQNSETYDFKFAFLTDIHLQPEKNAIKGFKLAIDTINKLQPNFVVTGGDLIMDALEQTYNRSDSLYDIYLEASELFEMPVYNTMGNHEVFGWFNGNAADTVHNEYGKAMFENRLDRKRYYSFSEGGWRFYVFDSTHKKDEHSYYGYIDSTQISWLKEDLSHIGKNIPIAIITHIPLVTVWTQLNYGAEQGNQPGVVVTNAKDILELFKNHNLKLVLQGHLHFYEDITVNGTRFVTGGAVSAKWWDGPNDGLEEGFVMVYVKDGNTRLEYIDYGWEVKN